jgi:myo-inositol-1-phosphate synthase
MSEVRVAIIGVGNCASSLVQGVYACRDQTISSKHGVISKNIGGSLAGDIKFVAAFDVDGNKVGYDLSDAINAPPNNTIKLYSVPYIGVEVSRGMTHDGLSRYTKDVVRKSGGRTCDVTGILRDAKVDVVVNYLPVGSEEATKWYVEQVLSAGCAFVNCIPVFIASDKTGYWSKRFTDAGVPIIGDDIKSQIGSTIIHRVLAKLFEDRGCTVNRTYQLNFGGNMDFLNMKDPDRLGSKKISKTGSVQSQLHQPLPDGQIHVGPSDYIPWLEDRKWAYIRIEGTNFGGAPVNLEVKLEVWDSPNSAGVVIDAIRCAKVAKDNGLAGPVLEPSSWYMKTPPVQVTDDAAQTAMHAWKLRYLKE